MGALLVILVATVVTFILGWLWYSPLLFGNVWMKLVKVTKKDAENVGAGTFISAFIASFVTNAVLYVVLTTVKASSIGAAVAIAVLLWLGFIATSFLSFVLWEKSSLQLYFIRIGHLLVSGLVGAIVIALMA